MSVSLERADCLEFLARQSADSIDLCFGSPPYEECRLYLENGVNMGISRKTDAWVAWMVEVYQLAQRACKGLVAFVVAGQTRNYRWSAGPALLMAELHRAGMNLRNPPIFGRVGIPGSGGPDWLRGDYEWIICTTRPGKLPWSDNTACGQAPRWAPGGAMSHRMSNGSRVNQWGHSLDTGGPTSSADGTVRKNARKPSHRQASKPHTKREPNGEMREQSYDAPVLANPGNHIERTYTASEVAALLQEHSDIREHIVGGGVMGNELCHQNEAPFPEALAEFFLLSFCPPAGTVCDPFSGSGTTAAMAKRHKRNFVGCDLRQSQVDLALKRVEQETEMMFA